MAKLVPIVSCFFVKLLESAIFNENSFDNRDFIFAEQLGDRLFFVFGHGGISCRQRNDPDRYLCLLLQFASTKQRPQKTR